MNFESGKSSESGESIELHKKSLGSSADQAQGQIPEEWRKPLESVLASVEIQSLRNFLRSEYKSGRTIYPPKARLFEALRLTPLSKVKVVILGQDPYHGPGQAHGLSFSVLPGVPKPPSLQNIFKELKSDLGIVPPDHGCLLGWAQQGVLMLNNVLSVQAGMPASHQGKGWEVFTDAVFRLVLQEKKHVVFVLWGSHAQKKIPLIDASQNLILAGPHPSPLSSHRGFFGSKPFSKTNQYLLSKGQTAIDWGHLPL